MQLDWYNATVSEDAAIGTTVLAVTASDLDLDRNGNVTYMLEMTSSDLDRFLIDSDSGVITLARCVADQPAIRPVDIDIYIYIYIVYLPVKQLARRCHRPLPKIIIARWRTARVVISLFMPNQS